MRIKLMAVVLLLMVGKTARAQQEPVLMRVDGGEVFRSEFLYGYRAAQAADSTVTEGQYLADFIDLKQKVVAAEAAGMDTLPIFLQAYAAARGQLLRRCLTNRETVEVLARNRYEASRAACGGSRVQVRQLLKRLPQNLSATDLEAVTHRMDSLSTVLRTDTAGRLFDTLVERFSDEKAPCWTDRLQMEEEFREAVSALSVGEVSSSFFTPTGIHIVKVLDRCTLPPYDALPDSVREYWRVRCAEAGAAVKAEQLKLQYAYTPNPQGMEELRSAGQTGQVLFTLGGRTYSGVDFARFAASCPASQHRQLEAFTQKSVLDYAAERLPMEQPEAYHHLSAFRDEALARLIWEREVGGKATSDEAGLKRYFDKHRDDYRWAEPRYKGVVIHAATKRAAKRARKFLKAMPEEERAAAVRLLFAGGTDSLVQARWGVFAAGDDAYVDEKVFKRQKATPVVSFPFTVLLGRKVKGAEDYHEVRDRLLEAYRRHLERLWVEHLRASCKVEINQEVLKTVNKH